MTNSFKSLKPTECTSSKPGLKGQQGGEQDVLRPPSVAVGGELALGLADFQTEFRAFQTPEQTAGFPCLCIWNGAPHTVQMTNEVLVLTCFPTGHGADVKCVDWHPTKGLVVSGSKDSQQPIKFWDPKTGQSLATL